MRKLTITSANGSVLEIGRLPSSFILQKLNGEGIPGTQAITFRSYNQDGSTHIETYVNDRELPIEMAIVEAAFDTLFELRQETCKVLNPKNDLTILYEYPGGSKKITGRLSGAVQFLRGGKKGYQKAAFTIECYKPFWEDPETTGERMAVSVPAFHFPLIFTPTIVFGIILNKTITIDNVDHVETPIKIQFLGPSENPVVTNETTGEFIKVEKTLLAGEILEINTEFGNKYVRIDDVNAFGFIDPDSTFFTLKPGENIMTYDADSGSESAEVLITYTNLYTGV